MFFKLLLLVATFSAFEIVFAQENNDHDLQYTAETYRTEIPKKDHLILFYMSWCGPSREMLPAWKQLAQQRNAIAGGRVRIAKVDCDDEPAICHANNVYSYPTIKYLFKDGSRIYYSGDRSFESMNSFIDSQLE